MAFGMMMGAIPTSVPMFILGLNWLVEGRFHEKWQIIKSQPLLWLMLSPWLLHSLGLIWTEDWHTGMTDFRVRIPMFAIPLIIFTTPAITIKEIKWVFWFFVLGCVVSTLWCIYYSVVLHPNLPLREASRYMSHIRLGMDLCLCVFVLGWLWGQGYTAWQKLVIALLIGYIIAVMLMMALFSGLFIFLIVGFGVGIKFMMKHTQPWFKVVVVLMPILLTALLIYSVTNAYQAQFTPQTNAKNQIHTQTVGGNLYAADTSHSQMENGYYVLYNVQPGEITRAWNREHVHEIIDLDKRMNLQRYAVLLRYMSSKGLYKDSLGYAALTISDKANIEKDIVNYKWSEWNALQKRTYELIFEWDEFRNHRNISGHSLSMRLYYWKAGWQVFKQHFLLGVGSGDVQVEMNKIFISEQYPLEAEWFKRPHNQFINEAAALGILGLTAFVALIFVPFYRLRKKSLTLYTIWWSVMLISFMFEDTLETQAGVACFTFFGSILARTNRH